ncbi:hypothetical protein ElyMa_002862700 [Elysia marginata]|uniref:Uncharacterized protein n=1 Tax=Elysia marginata TaxID=1093978 RepID=A0AAV4HWT4_9GAST|nr:hypothetical protein ElyMa_002862700 [Elysia marginata]
MYGLGNCWTKSINEYLEIFSSGRRYIEHSVTAFGQDILAATATSWSQDELCYNDCCGDGGGGGGDDDDYDDDDDDDDDDDNDVDDDNGVGDDGDDGDYDACDGAMQLLIGWCLENILLLWKLQDTSDSLEPNYRGKPRKNNSMILIFIHRIRELCPLLKRGVPRTLKQRKATLQPYYNYKDETITNAAYDDPTPTDTILTAQSWFQNLNNFLMTDTRLGYRMTTTVGINVASGSWTN